MEYFVSPQPSPPQHSSPPEVRVQDIIQRKADLILPAGVKEFQSANNGWTPMSEEFGPRKLK